MVHRNGPLTPQARLRLCRRVEEGRAVAHVAGLPWGRSHRQPNSGQTPSPTRRPAISTPPSLLAALIETREGHTCPRAPPPCPRERQCVPRPGVSSLECTFGLPPSHTRVDRAVNSGAFGREYAAQHTEIHRTRLRSPVHELSLQIRGETAAMMDPLVPDQEREQLQGEPRRSKRWMGMGQRSVGVEDGTTSRQPSTWSNAASTASQGPRVVRWHHRVCQPL